MMDPFTILAWVAIVIALGLIFWAVRGMVQDLEVYLSQLVTNIKRKRAHAGKVGCEDEKEHCENIATRETPNGYFCNVHWMENMKKLEYKEDRILTRSWANLLNHAMKPGEVRTKF